MTRLFHLVPAEPWEAHLAAGHASFEPPSLAREGFVHLSFAHQLQGTLAAHFPRASRLVLVEVRLASDAALVVEPSRGGDLFPHLHRALHRRDCLGTFRLERRGGAWEGLAEALAGGRPAPLAGSGAGAGATPG